MRVFSFGCQALQNIFRAYTEGILFAGSKDVCQNNDICHGKYFGKIIQKSFGAGVGVWLEYQHQALMRIFLRGGQCSADLCRMMCIIVNDGDTVYGSFVLETAVGTVESVRENDKEMIETIRSVTDLPIAVDINQGWKDKEKAIDEIFWLKEHGIVMVEQPMPKELRDDIAWLTEKSPLPIFADEAIQRLKDIKNVAGAYSGINIKLMKCTGMHEAWKMLNYARAIGMKVMVGCMTETSCAVSAAAQLSPAVDFADLDGNLLISNDRFKGMEVVKGKITLPDRPGIGVVKL